MDIHDDFHGSEGPVPILRRSDEEWTPIQTALYRAAVTAGFPEDGDMNGPESTGVATLPLNNPGGIRMSAALTHLNQAGHRLTLTVRPTVLARRVVFDGQRATGVEVESGGEVFVVEGAEVVHCAGGRTAPTDDELASDELLDEYLLRTQGTSRHVSGTFKLGPASDAMAVVDQYGLLHGLEG